MEKENQVQDEVIEVRKIRTLSNSGFWLSIIALFISFHGIVSLVALILSFIDLSKSKDSSKAGKMALLGIFISLVGLVYSSLRMIGIL